MSKVRVIYDFNAEASNELTTYSGEQLTVLDPNAFEGWLKIRNARGEEGIVPSSYVEYIEDDLDNDIPPPPSHNPINTANSWDTPPAYVNSYSNQSFNSSYINQPVGVFNSSYNPPEPSYKPPVTAYKPPAPRSAAHDSDSDDFDEDEPAVNNTQRSSNAFNTTLASVSSSSGTITKHKTKNSFGLDTFLLLGAVKNVPESDRCSTIILNEHRNSLWKRRSPPYWIAIINYHNDKKYHGVKKFITYEIQTEKFPQKVKRRYNQFDWLHKRLEEKYPNICTPPLPDKAVTGNFEDEFIMKRKAQLELWLNRLSSHPVISESEVFIHFLQCDDTSSKWKAGKRKAEKDEYRGAQWFCTLTVPGESVDTTLAIKDKIEKFSKSTAHLDNSVKSICGALDKIGTYHTSSYKKEIINLGKRFEDLGSSLSADPLDAPNNSALSRAMVTAGNTYTQIGNLYGEQAKEDIGPLFDRFSLYRGLIQQMPDIVQFEKNSIQTYEEFTQRPEKLQGRNLHEIAPRREIISHVTFAEINQFNRDKVDDITNYMRSFLQKQIDFYSEITDCLKRAQSSFDQIPVAKQSMPNLSSSFNKTAKR